jgi:2-aminoadipate transaminase
VSRYTGSTFSRKINQKKGIGREEMTTDWGLRYAKRTQQMKSSAIRELLKLTAQTDIISFAGGMPAPELFPTQRIEEAACRVLREQGNIALQYGTTEGYPPLREMIIRHMERYGIHAKLQNVLITAGSQQGLDLIGRVLVDPGSHVIAEEPTYLGAIQAWAMFEPEYITVPSDADGLHTDSLEDALKHNDIRFIYALPNFQNPSGSTLSRERRETLVRLANHYSVPIVEDDPYGQLRYDGEHETPLIALDAQNVDGNGDNFITGNVLYMSTFSKTLCPGFRVAWVVGPEEVIQKMVQAKQGADLHTSTLTQMIAYETARGGFLDEHILHLRKVYRERRDLMLSLMEELFPPGVTWTRPKGGLFTWVELPKGMNTQEMFDKAVAQKVAFVPGAAFFPRGGGENTMRLNFSNARPEQIEEGMERLAAVIKAEMVLLGLA